MINTIYLIILSGLLAILYGYIVGKQILASSPGNNKMQEIAEAIQIGARAYLNRQYKTIAIVGVIILLIVTFALGIWVGLGYFIGAFLSAAAGYIGMLVSVQANVRTAEASRKGLAAGLNIGFKSGAVTGMLVAGLALLSISIYYLFLVKLNIESREIINALVGLGFGASLISIFARLGGGIFTKGADVGADLVGKVEAGIPEDDPRNPAVIADNVGDNVGDVAGMGADLYESYAGSVLATAALGVAAVITRHGVSSIGQQINYLAMPMVLAAVGVILSVIGIYIVRTKEDAGMQELMRSLNRGINVSAAGIAIVALPLVFAFDLERPWLMWITILNGLLVGIVIGKATEYYTSHDFQPTQDIVVQGQSGPATVIIQGLAVGMRSTAIPVITISVGIAIAFYFSGGAESTLMGLYGVGLAAVAMLSTLGITLATDAYGPIADNAGGNAEMAGLSPEVRKRTDELDAVGNTTAATGKGFAIGSAALTALALLAAYLEEIRFSLLHLRGLETLTIRGVDVAVETMTMKDFMTYYDVTLLNPAVLIGIFIGAMTVFFFSAMTMSAVGRAAGDMVLEVRRQFKEIPGIMDGTATPDYARCVEISTKGAQKEMIAPAALAISIPVVVGLLFGVAGVLGLLSGGLATGFVMAVMMANAGGAWDNAKKMVEAGAHGGKGSEVHKATVVGDTVGDPFKDTSGPSLNILIKLMSMVSVVFAGLIASVGVGGLMGQLLSFF